MSSIVGRLLLCSPFAVALSIAPVIYLTRTAGEPSVRACRCSQRGRRLERGCHFESERKSSPKAGCGF